MTGPQVTSAIGCCWNRARSRRSGTTGSCKTAPPHTCHADERAVRIQLTPEGGALKEKAGGIPEAIGCATGLALPDIIELTTEVKALRDKLVDAQTNALGSKIT